jgi:hypothetical protein
MTKLKSLLCPHVKAIEGKEDLIDRIIHLRDRGMSMSNISDYLQIPMGFIAACTGRVKAYMRPSELADIYDTAEQLDVTVSDYVLWLHNEYGEHLAKRQRRKKVA